MKNVPSSMWLVKRGDEKCFGAQADLKRAMCIQQLHG
jgi:hypothetical protein